MSGLDWQVVRRRKSQEDSSSGSHNMSASPMARAATMGQPQDIPTRRVIIANEDDMPSDYSTTPGGTIFGTTPGGTKIVYERAFLWTWETLPCRGHRLQICPIFQVSPRTLVRKTRKLRTMWISKTITRRSRMGMISFPWTSKSGWSCWSVWRLPACVRTSGAVEDDPGLIVNFSQCPEWLF